MGGSGERKVRRGHALIRAPQRSRAHNTNRTQRSPNLYQGPDAQQDTRATVGPQTLAFCAAPALPPHRPCQLGQLARCGDAGVLDTSAGLDALIVAAEERGMGDGRDLHLGKGPPQPLVPAFGRRPLNHVQLMCHDFGATAAPSRSDIQICYATNPHIPQCEATLEVNYPGVPIELLHGNRYLFRLGAPTSSPPRLSVNSKSIRDCRCSALSSSGSPRR